MISSLFQVRRDLIILDVLLVEDLFFLIVALIPFLAVVLFSLVESFVVSSLSLNLENE